jgi:hypothetical protein
MPKPKRIDGMCRWDLEGVRLAFKALPDENDPADASWSDVDAS